MKTPREILIGRHGGTKPKLDQMRHAVVAGLSDQRVPLFQRLVCSCEEFFRLPRTALAGLGIAWIAIVALNVASTETPRANVLVTSASAKPSPEMLQALREQKQLFAEMVGAITAPDADAPRFVPRPRSERSTFVALT